MKVFLRNSTYQSITLFISIIIVQIISVSWRPNQPADSLKKADFDYLFNQIRSVDDAEIRCIYLKEFLEKAKREKNDEELVNGYRNYVHYISKDHVAAYADSMVYVAEKSKNNKLKSDAYLSRGIAYYGLKNYNGALEDYLTAYNFSLKTENLYLQYKIKYNLAHIKYYLGHYTDAIVLFKECVDFFKDGNTRAYLNSLHSLALSYNRMGNIGMSAHWIEMGVQEAERIGDNSMDAYFMHLSGVNEFFRENYNLTIQHITSSLPEIQKIDDFGNEAVGNFYIGKAYWKLGKLPLAISYFEKVDEILHLRQYTRSDLREAYELLIQFYQSKNDLPKQLFYTKRLSTVDSILRENQQVLNPKIHKKYDIIKLELKKSEAESNLNKSRKTVIILTGLIILFTVVGIYLTIQFRKTQKENKAKFKALMDQNSSKKTPEVKSVKSTTQDKDLSEVISGIAIQLEKFESSKKFLEKDITLVKLAAAFNSNTNYLSIAIHQIKNKNFPDYINDLKTQYIIEMLKTYKKFRNYNNAALAKEAGFSSTQRFTNAFRSNTGLTPGYFITELKKRLDA